MEPLCGFSFHHPILRRVSLLFIKLGIHFLYHRFPESDASIYEPIGNLASKARISFVTVKTQPAFMGCIQNAEDQESTMVNRRTWLLVKPLFTASTCLSLSFGYLRSFKHLPIIFTTRSIRKHQTSETEKQLTGAESSRTSMPVERRLISQANPFGVSKIDDRSFLAAAKPIASAVMKIQSSSLFPSWVPCLVAEK